MNITQVKSTLLTRYVITKVVLRIIQTRDSKKSIPILPQEVYNLKRQGLKTLINKRIL